MTESPLAHKWTFVLLGPLLFALVWWFFPANLISPLAYKALALAAWMVCWWVTEAVPIPVTAMLPLIIFPASGLMTSEDAAAPYAHPTIFLFLGGFMLALALEKHKLHERIALLLLRYTGTTPNGIILGFMLATAFISMWISNTATAMMMMPMALSVVHLINQQHDEGLLAEKRKFALSLMLSVGYAATLGGLATIIGTPPNVVFKGLLEKFYGQQIDFGSWLLVGLPVSMLTLGATYLIVTRILFRIHIATISGSTTLFEDRLKALGPVSAAEKRVLVLFSMTSFLWIFQQPLNEWVIGAKLLNDAGIAIAGGLLMFMVPVKGLQKSFLLEWKDTEKIHWGVLLLFGGGMSMAGGLEKAGIIEAAGNFASLNMTYSITAVFIFITITVLLSELMSNVALVQIFIPVVFGISNGLGISPLELGIPVTLAASIGFMLPIATPPNAIVFSSGYIRIQDMARAGLLLNLVCILIIGVASLTLLKWIF